MNTTIEAFQYCPHYDEIVNFPIPHDDYISEMLINDYREYVFSKEPNQEILIHYDKILYQYIENTDFYRFVQRRYNEEPTWESYTDLENMLEEYQERTLSTIDTSKWI